MKSLLSNNRALRPLWADSPTRGFVTQVRQNIGCNLERADPGGRVVDHAGDHQFIGLERIDQRSELPSHCFGRSDGRTDMACLT